MKRKAILWLSMGLIVLFTLGCGGDDTSNETPDTEDASGEDTSEKDTSEKDASGKDASGEDTSGEDTSDKDVALEDTGAADTFIEDTDTKETVEDTVEECTPDCDDKNCGDDGCGGSCGTCDEGICANGVCETGGCIGNCGEQAAGCWCDDLCFSYEDCCDNVCIACAANFPDECCTPECSEKECGFDGCSGECGSCSAGTKCEEFQCVNCTGKCIGKTCGSDDCNGSCGECGDGFKCVSFACEACTAECTDKECGFDGCSGSCGECSGEEECQEGLCVSPDSCEGKCGTFQGDCACDSDCWSFGDCCDDLCDFCEADFQQYCCEPQCDGKVCGDDGCGAICGLCEAGTKCNQEGECESCEPQCDGKDCGDDQCNGTCGTCEGTWICNDEGVCEDCTPDCGNTPCAPDGCNGFCDCPVDCANLDGGPFLPVKIPGAIASEGIAFDGEGNLVGSNIQHIFRSTYDGTASVFVPNLEQRAGLAFLPNGDLVVNDNFTGTVWRVTPDGVKFPIATGLVYPNGITVDMEGYVYTTDETQSLVIKVDPFGLNEVEVLSEGTILHPNGIAFDNTYTKLFVAGWQGDGFIWMIPRNEDGSFGDPEKFSVQLGNGLDGLEVDICGNLYVNDYANGGMLRVTPDGQSFSLVVDEGFWIPNMQWGAGIGGWSPTKMYVPNGSTFEVYEINVGVPMKPRPYPPMTP